MNQIKRLFIPGDTWLYYKFYLGPKTADKLLVEVLQPLMKQLMVKNHIKKWFFIRYADPKEHLRFRCEMVSLEAMPVILAQINQALAPYTDSKLIWKVQIDTYKRELERYGNSSMVVCEEIFCHDSEMVSGLVNLVDQNPNNAEQQRWLIAMLAVDEILNDNGLDLNQKTEVFKHLHEGFGKEFGMNKALRVQIDAKYRRFKKEIASVLERQANDDFVSLYEIVSEKSIRCKELYEEISKMREYDKTIPNPVDLLSSFSHMLLNRLFRSKQRMQEMVVYGLLYRYYHSQAMRLKYSKQSKKAIPLNK